MKSFIHAVSVTFQGQLRLDLPPFKLDPVSFESHRSYMFQQHSELDPPALELNAVNPRGDTALGTDNILR